MALAVLGVRAFALQAVERDSILKAQDARVHRRFLLTPRRGDILFADGTPAATDEPGFSVQLDPTAFEATRWRCDACGAVVASRTAPKSCACGAKGGATQLPSPDLHDLARTLALSDAQLGERFDKVTQAHAAAPEIGVFPLVDRVSSDVALALSLAWERFPGVSVRTIRVRSVDAVAAAVVGRTRPAWRAELKTLVDPARAERDERVYTAAEVYSMRFGSRGLERTFDARLRGDPGRAFRPAGADPASREPQMEVPVVDGAPVRTTLRRDVQAVAEDVVRGASGDASAVVLDAATGAVVAVASRSRDGLHHAVCGIRPGSVFKLVTALAILESGLSPHETVVCQGKGRLPSGRRYVCDEVHGALDLADAFAHSCNAYFETMTERLDSDAMRRACCELGLDASPRLHLNGTRAGVRPTFGATGRLSPSEMRFLSIGQGRALASPLQIAVAYARVASGGRLVAPYLVDDDAPAPAEMDSSIARFAPLLCDGARRVVTRGTGSGVRELVELGAGGKSGTADTAVSGSSNNAWFVAFAPADAPRYVAVVVYERVTGHGAATVGSHAGRLLQEALR